MAYSRNRVADIIDSWIGLKMSDKSHKGIIDIYNTIKPLPRGMKMTYTAPYCATTVSACYHKAGYDSIFPFEASCGEMIKKAKNMGIWVEDETTYVPKIGDCVLYDWNDGKDAKTKDWSHTDNQNAPQHVGLVTSVSGNSFIVTEGNMGSDGHVGTRSMKVNGRYIRGYVCPKFEASSNPAPASTTTTSSSKYPTLYVGSKETEWIKKLHKALHEQKPPYGTDPNNGVYNQLTVACVTNYQLTHGLIVDGIAGEQTLSSLGL